MAFFVTLPLMDSALQQTYTLFQVLFLLAGLNPTPTPYGKFFQGRAAATYSVPSRVGMFVIYFPAFVVAACWAATSINFLESTRRLDVITLLLLIHFGKRLLEVLFLHVYSGTLDLIQAMCVITVSYAVNTHMILTSCSSSTSSSKLPDTVLVPGLTLFVVGQAINFYHHYLLAALRNDSSMNKREEKELTNKKYLQPRGGLFSTTCCPHFFGEILAWIGIALISQHLTVWLVTGGMTSYLLGRSYSTTRFYRERLPAYKPAYHLIPGVF